MDSLDKKILQCRTAFELKFLDEKTHLIYDYLTSFDFDKRFDHLPTPEEIALRYPNPCGWGSGMEDSSINAGIAIDMYLDAGEAEWARWIYQGMKLCGTISGVPGFVARSVSPRDGKSFYPESSRDQYTHYVYGLWRYWQSPFSTKEEKAECVKLLVEVAQFSEKYITKENNWTWPRADFVPEVSNVHKMWEVAPHEAARLPMIYAVAWNVSGDSHWETLYRQFAESAADQSMELWCQSYYAYALLQMQLSCTTIYEIETDDAVKAKFLKAMEQINEYVGFSLLQAVMDTYQNKMDDLPPDWRTISQQHTIVPRHFVPVMPKAWSVSARIIREAAETMMIRLLTPAPVRKVRDTDRRFFRFIMDKMDPDCYAKYSIFYPVAVWYKAKKLGIEL